MIPDHVAAEMRELTRLMEADGHYWCDHAKGVFRCSAPQEPAQGEPAKEPDGPTEDDLSATEREMYANVLRTEKTEMTDAFWRRQFGLPPRETDEASDEVSHQVPDTCAQVVLTRPQYSCVLTGISYSAPQKPTQGEPAKDAQDQRPDDAPDANGDGGGL